MARSCFNCGKSSHRSATRSHSNIKTLRRQFPNLQKVDGKMICTRCLRTRAKQRA